MTRIHSPNKGKSQSTKPIERKRPEWKIDDEKVLDVIIKMAKEGQTPSQIGQTLRDEYNVPDVKAIFNKSLLKILKENKVEPEVPEDLDKLVNRAAILHNHLKRNKADRKNNRSLELLEAKIHRVSKYYKRKGVIPKSWKYSAVVAQLT